MPIGTASAMRVRNGMPNMWHAATRPCSMLVEASAGNPITSPAANTLWQAVR